MSHDIPDNSVEKELERYEFLKEFMDKNKGKEGFDAKSLLKQFNEVLQSPHSVEELEALWRADAGQLEDALMDTENPDQEAVDKLITILWARTAIYRSVINVAKGLN